MWRCLPITGQKIIGRVHHYCPPPRPRPAPTHTPSPLPRPHLLLVTTPSSSGLRCRSSMCTGTKYKGLRCLQFYVSLEHTRKKQTTCPASFARPIKSQRLRRGGERKPLENVKTKAPNRESGVKNNSCLFVDDCLSAVLFKDPDGRPDALAHAEGGQSFI